MGETAPLVRSRGSPTTTTETEEVRLEVHLPPNLITRHSCNNRCVVTAYDLALYGVRGVVRRIFALHNMHGPEVRFFPIEP